MPPRMSAPVRQSAWPPHIENRAEPKVPASSNVQGAWENGVFRFQSPEAIEAWRRKAYRQGISADNWHHGEEIDDKTRDLALADIGGATPPIYQGLDGKYRFGNVRTIEDKDARDHRLQHIQGKTIDQIAAAKMPGEDEWIAKGKAVRGAINAAGNLAIASSAAAPGQTETKSQRVIFVPDRLAAMKRIADVRIAAKHDIQRTAGKWEVGSFIFDSLEDHQRWARAAYRQGVSEDTWYLGKVVDPKSVDSAAANPGLYRAPDGTYRLMSDPTVESETVRAHRDQYRGEHAIDQVANGASMPGEDEWVEKWTTAWREGRPGLGRRFGAAAKRTIVDGSIGGAVAQQFASGYAHNPDTLATRPNDAFLQSGSHGMLEWYRLHDDLGIGGGKRLIDFLPEAERQKAETEWGKMSAQQQAGMRKMFEEKQASYRP